jgi:hypothetical protein
MTNDERNRAAAVAGASSPPQAADIRNRWWWVEHSVWTDRMLIRLEHSEPTTKWFRLWDKVLSERNLQAAFWAVWRNGGAPGVDGQTVKQFGEQLESELARLGDELKSKRYRRQPARRVWIPKPGTPERRPLGIPAVRDRTVEAALRHVLEPIFERDFAQSSYGFRPGRGCREAVARVEELLSQGHVWCVDADLKSYFDTIPHDRLMALVRERIVDGSVLSLLEQCLKAGVMEELKGWQPTERGTPQGAVISPAFGQPVSQPAGPRTGTAGLGAGALRGRLRCAVPDQRRSSNRTSVPAPMDCGGRIDPAPDQDAPGSCDGRRLRLFGLALSRWQEMAAEEEPSETAGEVTTADEAEQWAEPERHYRAGESDPAGLVWLLPGQSLDGSEKAGPVAAATPAGDAAQTGEAAWIRAESSRQPTVAEPLVCGAGAI